MHPQNKITLYIALRGHAFGVGNPVSISPRTDEISLLCGVTFVPLTIEIWTRTLQKTGSIEDATNHIINTHGGIMILRPTNIHLNELARKTPSITPGES